MNQNETPLNENETDTMVFMDNKAICLRHTVSVRFVSADGTETLQKAVCVTKFLGFCIFKMYIRPGKLEIFQPTKAQAKLKGFRRLEKYNAVLYGQNPKHQCFIVKIDSLNFMET